MELKKSQDTTNGTAEVTGHQEWNIRSQRTLEMEHQNSQDTVYGTL